MSEVLMVTTGPKLLYSPPAGVKGRVTIQNLGSNIVEVDYNSALTFGTGIQLAATTGTYTSPPGILGSLYGITTTGNQSTGSGVRVIAEATVI